MQYSSLILLTLQEEIERAKGSVSIGKYCDNDHEKSFTICEALRRDFLIANSHEERPIMPKCRGLSLAETFPA